MGQISWNKGLTKDTDERVRAYGKKGSITKQRLFSSAIGDSIRRKIGLHNFYRGKVGPRKGIKWLEAERQLISQRTKEGMRKKGYGPSPEEIALRRSQAYFDWRKSVFERDDFTCLKCEDRGGNLAPHHIYGFHECPEKRFVVSNGGTLCLGCHQDFHKQFGRKNNSLEQLQVFLGTT
jgi:hypothetical protein